MTDPPRRAGLPPGYDEEDPYEDVDLSTLPAWWRAAVAEFRDHEMRPFRPSRLADGEIAAEVVSTLGSRHGVTVAFRAVDPDGSGDWEVWVDGEPVAPVGHDRLGDGYTTYDITSEELERLVLEHCG